MTWTEVETSVKGGAVLVCNVLHYIRYYLDDVEVFLPPRWPGNIRFLPVFHNGKEVFGSLQLLFEEENEGVVEV